MDVLYYTDIFMRWLILTIKDIFFLSFQDYLAFKTEFDRRQKIFQRLEEKVLNKKAVKVTPKMWAELEPKWKDIARRTRMWLWKLDASLPGRLGKFGDWLNQAEEMLEIEPEQREDLMEMAEQIVKLLNDHKVRFCGIK